MAGDTTLGIAARPVNLQTGQTGQTAADWLRVAEIGHVNAVNVVNVIVMDVMDVMDIELALHMWRCGGGIADPQDEWSKKLEQRFLCGMEMDQGFCFRLPLGLGVDPGQP